MNEDRYLISRSEIEAMPWVEEGHFLNPDVARERCSLGHLTGLTGIGFHIVTIPPGKETTGHF